MNNLTKTQLKKEFKRKSLLKAAAKIFSEQGYMNSSIKNITDTAGVATGTFYSYFNNKEEILNAIYDDIFEASLNAASNAAINEKDDIVKKFVCAVASAMCTYIENKDISKMVLLKTIGISDITENKRQKIIDKTSEYIETVLKHLVYKHSIKIEYIHMTSILITNNILGIIKYWLDDKIDIDVNEMILTICRYNLNALKIEFDEKKINTYISYVISLHSDCIND